MLEGGMPGLQGSEHIGITVPDMDAAVEFFTRVIGGDLIFDGGAFGGDAQFMTQVLNVHADATLRYCFVRCRTGVNFEIFEYKAPEQRTQPPRNSDIGGHHIAFYVDDIDAAVDHLRAHDVRVLGDVQVITDGPAAGSSWVYFLAPWGLQLELVSYPAGKGYERTAEHKLWHPGHPEQ
jgi:catechol 2,3-dioxygenase-like lactoylglutathione lyase family enzyme